MSLFGPNVEKLKAKRDIAGLVGALRDDKEPGVRRNAAKALGEIGDPSAVDGLVAALTDPDWRVPAAAAEALGQIGDPRAVGRLIGVLPWAGTGLRGKSLRSAALAALRKMGAGAVEPSIGALEGSDRDAAVSALASIGAPAVAALIAALKQDGRSRGAAEALGMIGDASAVRPLIQALVDPDKRVGKAAAEALGMIRDVRAVSPLVEALADPDWRVGKAAASALGKIGDVRAVEPLISCVTEADQRVRQEATNVLGQLGAPATAILVAALHGEDRRRSQTAESVLAVLGWKPDGDKRGVAQPSTDRAAKASVIAPPVAQSTSRKPGRRPAAAKALEPTGDPGTGKHSARKPGNDQRVAVLSAIESALRLSAPTLAGDPRRIPGQLVGRLAGHTERGIADLLQVVRERAPRPWLCPLTPALAPAGGPLEQDLHGHKTGMYAMALKAGDASLVPDEWGPVRAVAVTPDGGQIVSGGDDGTVRVWDRKSGRLEHTLGSYEGVALAAVAVTPDGARIVAGGGRMVRVWDRATGRLERTLEGSTSDVKTVAVTPDGAKIVTCGGPTVRVWDLATGRLEQTLKGGTSEVNAVVVTPDGAKIVSGGGRMVRVWDLATGRLELTLSGHTGDVYGLAVTPDGARIASGASDGTVRLWDLGSQLTLRTLKSERLAGAVAVTPDGERILSLGDGLRIWNIATGRLEAAVGAAGLGIAVTPDGTRIVSAGWRSLSVWGIEGALRQSELEGCRGRVLGVAVDGATTRIISGGGIGAGMRLESDGAIRVWDLATGRLERTLEGHKYDVETVAVTPDGAKMVSGAGDDTIRVWDLATGRLERTLEDPVSTVAVTPDGRWIVSGSRDNSVRVWDLTTGRLEHVLKGHSDGVGAIAIAKDGRRIVSGGMDGQVRIWNLDSGRLERTVGDQTTSVELVAITPDGAKILVGGRRPDRMEGREYIEQDYTVRVWDRATGRLERTLEGFGGPIRAIALTPQGGRILSGRSIFSWPDTLTVWDFASGRRIASWIPESGISECCAHPTDSSIFACSGAGRIDVLRLLEASA